MQGGTLGFDYPARSLKPLAAQPNDMAPTMSPYATWHVHPDGDLWVVKKAGSPGTITRHTDEVEALSQATEMALRDRPAQLIRHTKQGRAPQCVTYDTKAPIQPEDPAQDEDPPAPTTDHPFATPTKAPEIGHEAGRPPAI